MRKIIVALGLFVLAGCGSGDDEPAARASDETGQTNSANASVLPAPTSIPVSDLGTEHVEPPVSFEQSPSIGGDHFPFWQNCGFYTVELIEGAATHSLEHGAVWITYNESSISEGDLETLETLADGNSKLLISPYPHDEPFVFSAWGVQQRGITAVDSPEAAAFIETWAENPELREATVTCQGAAGIPPIDVRTLADGEQVPENYN